MIALWSENKEEGSATASFKWFPGGVLEQTKCAQKKPEAPRLQLSHMQTQLTQSGLLPSAHFLHLALRKAERERENEKLHCPEGASEMLSDYTQKHTCAHQCIPDM